MQSTVGHSAPVKSPWGTPMRHICATRWLSHENKSILHHEAKLFSNVLEQLPSNTLLILTNCAETCLK